MATLSIIWWRDIPAQVVAKDARRSSKVVLHPRFQVAIDKAANRAGKREYNSYIAEWHKTHVQCGDDLEAVVAAEAAAGRLALDYERRSTGLGELAPTISAFVGAGQVRAAA